jgi:NAD(P)-dependent dehydrogenase (short-subunit alcohol dehydrogenase family)
MDDKSRPLKLIGKRAVVTGGGGGFGRMVAKSLLEEGSDVVLLDVVEESLLAAVGDLNPVAEVSGARVVHYVCDAFNEDQIKEAVSYASESQGRLDIAISLVGTGVAEPVLLHDKGTFEQHLLGNVVPAFLLMKHACAVMAKGGGGSFVAISSINAICPEALLSAYCSGKAALDALIRVGAKELGPLGIRVNSIRPGLTRTPATKDLFESAAYVDAFIAQQAIKRSGEPQDVGALVAFLAGPDASWITGQSINIDGGLSLHGIPKPNGRSLLYASFPESWRVFME